MLWVFLNLVFYFFLQGKRKRRNKSHWNTMVSFVQYSLWICECWKTVLYPDIYWEKSFKARCMHHLCITWFSHLKWGQLLQSNYIYDDKRYLLCNCWAKLSCEVLMLSSFTTISIIHCFSGGATFVWQNSQWSQEVWASWRIRNQS